MHPFALIREDMDRIDRAIPRRPWPVRKAASHLRRSVRTDARRLGCLGLFHGLSRRARSLVSRQIERLTVEPGRTLLREGRTLREFVVVEAGHVAVSQAGATRRLLGPGEWYGHRELLAGRPSEATLTAVDEAKLLVLGPREFFGLLRLLPAFAERIGARAAAGRRRRGLRLERSEPAGIVC